MIPDFSAMPALVDEKLSPAAIEHGARRELVRLNRWELPTAWTDQAGAWVLMLPAKLQSPNRYRSHWRALNGSRKRWELLVWATAARALGCATRQAMDELGRTPNCQEPMALAIVRFVRSSREYIRDDDNLRSSPWQAGRQAELMTPALQGIDEAIARLEADLVDLRKARDTVVRVCGCGTDGNTLDPDPSPVRRAAVQDGTLEHRILVACGEPTKISAIVESASARKPDVKRVVAELVKAKRLKAIGGGSARRYQRI